jgi:hypothetical protein
VFPISALGESDCETIGDEFLAQPVNALSSFAYCIVGLWVIWRGFRGDAARRPYLVVFGLVLVFTGLGSVAFHGPQWAGSKWLHDVPIAWIAVFIVVYDLAIAFRWSSRATWAGMAAGFAGVGLLLAVTPESTEVVTGSLAAGVLVGEFLVCRRRRDQLRPRGRTWRHAAYWAALALFALGAAVNLLGRTDAPLCEPDSILQGHGLWHVLTALAFGAISYAVLELRTPPGSDR